MLSFKGIDGKCLGKISYSSELKALEASRKRYFTHHVVPYRCKFCDRWHLGGKQSRLKVPRRLK